MFVYIVLTIALKKANFHCNSSKCNKYRWFKKNNKILSSVTVLYIEQVYVVQLWIAKVDPSIPRVNVLWNLILAIFNTCNFKSDTCNLDL